MALNNVVSAISDGGSGATGFDLDINPESFYIAYKIIENVCPYFDNLPSVISSVSDVCSYLGVDFSSILSKIKKDVETLNNLNERMGKFKTTLEYTDSSNTLLFNEMDLTMFENFGEDMSETDQALYIEKCTTIYNLAKDKDPDDLTEIEKSIIENFGPYMKLNDYINLENDYGRVDEKYQAICDEIYSLTRTNGKLSGEDSAKLRSLTVQRDSIAAKRLELKTKKDSLRTELINEGLIEMNAGEELTAANIKLWNSFKDIFKTNGDLGAILVEADEFMSELQATGAVVATNITAGTGKLVEYVVDGVIMVGVGVASAGTGLYDGVNSIYCNISGADFSSATKSMWNDTMDLIANDTTGNIYNAFYNTKVGEMLNNTSALKFDGAGAELIKNATTKVAEVVAATAATVVTGGTAAPFVAAGLGFLEGTGKEAERRFSEGNREVKDIFSSYLSGVGTAAEWYGYGQVGSNLYSGVKNLVSKVPSNLSQSAVTNAFKTSTKSNLNVIGGALKKTFKTADIYLDVGGAIANSAITVINKGEIDTKETLFDLGFAIGGNIVGDIIGGFVDRKGARKIVLDMAGEGSNNTYINKLGEIIQPGSTGNSISDAIPIMDTVKKGNFSNVTAQLLSLTDDEFNIALKNMSKAELGLLLGSSGDISKIVSKIDITDVDLLKQISSCSFIDKTRLAKNFTDSQIYKIFTSNDSDVSNLGEILITGLNGNRINSLFNDFDFSLYKDRITSNDNLKHLVYSFAGSDYYKSTFGDDEYLKIFSETLLNNGNSTSLCNLSKKDLTLYFNSLASTKDFQKIIDITNAPNFDKNSFYRYVESIADMDDFDECIKHLNSDIIPKGVSLNDLYVNLKDVDADKLNKLLYYSDIRVYTRSDGSNLFLKYDSNYFKNVDGKPLYSVWFSDGKTANKLVYTDFDPNDLFSDGMDDDLKKFIADKYFDTNRVSSLVNFRINQSFLGSIISTNGIYDYYYDADFMEALSTNKDKFVKLFTRNNAFSKIYGFDQHSLSNMSRSDILTLKDISKDLSKKYNINQRELLFALSKVDTKEGVCSFADLCTKIFSYYEDEPLEFYKDFGYPMFRVSANGKSLSYNAEELLADLYVFYNSSLNGNGIFTYNAFGKMKLDPSKVGLSQSLSFTCFNDPVGAMDMSVDLQNRFFIHNNIPLRTNMSMLDYDTIDSSIIQKVNAEISRGKYPSLITRYDKSSCTPFTYEMLDLNYPQGYGNLSSVPRLFAGDMDVTSTVVIRSDGTFEKTFSHITPITGIDENYIYIASWGELYRINLSELNNSNSQIKVQEFIKQ